MTLFKKSVGDILKLIEKLSPEEMEELQASMISVPHGTESDDVHDPPAAAPDAETDGDSESYVAESSADEGVNPVSESDVNEDAEQTASADAEPGADESEKQPPDVGDSQTQEDAPGVPETSAVDAVGDSASAIDAALAPVLQAIEQLKTQVESLTKQPQPADTSMSARLNEAVRTYSN